MECNFIAKSKWQMALILASLQITNCNDANYLPEIRNDPASRQGSATSNPSQSLPDATNYGSSNSKSTPGDSGTAIKCFNNNQQYILPNNWRKYDQFDQNAIRNSPSTTSFDPRFTLRVIAMGKGTDQDAQLKAKQAYNRIHCDPPNQSEWCNPGPQYRELQIAGINAHLEADYSLYGGAMNWGTTAFFAKSGQIFRVEIDGQINENIDVISSIVQTINPLP